MLFSFQAMTEENKNSIKFEAFKCFGLRDIRSKWIKEWTLNDSGDCLIYLKGKGPQSPHYFGVIHGGYQMTLLIDSEIVTNESGVTVRWKVTDKSLVFPPKKFVSMCMPEVFNSILAFLPDALEVFSMNFFGEDVITSEFIFEAKGAN